MPNKLEWPPEVEEEDTKKSKKYPLKSPPPPRLRVKPENPAEKLKEIEALKRSIGIGVETEDSENIELKKLIEEFKDDLEGGKVAYQISTKIPKGTSYRGYTENDQGIENYKVYSVKGEGKNALEPSSGIRTDGWGWDKLGNVLAILAPVERYKKTVETVTEERKTFWGGTKQVQTQKEVGKNVQMTLADCGIKDGPNEALYSLSIQYGVDNSGFKEKRRISNMMNITMPEKLARGISKEIAKNPKNLWKVLESIEPELMELAPPETQPTDPDQPQGLVYYDLKNSHPDYRTIKPTKVIPE